MNNNRRKKLREWIRKAELLTNELEEIEADEEYAYDNMPEGLQSSENGVNSEDAIDTMNTAIDCMNEAIGCIEEII